MYPPNTNKLTGGYIANIRDTVPIIKIKILLKFNSFSSLIEGFIKFLYKSYVNPLVATRS